MDPIPEKYSWHNLLNTRYLSASSTLLLPEMTSIFYWIPLLWNCICGSSTRLRIPSPPPTTFMDCKILPLTPSGYAICTQSPEHLLKDPSSKHCPLAVSLHSYLSIYLYISQVLISSYISDSSQDRHVLSSSKPQWCSRPWAWERLPLWSQLACWMLNLRPNPSSINVNQRTDRSRFGFLWNLNMGYFIYHIKITLSNSFTPYGSMLKYENKNIFIYLFIQQVLFSFCIFSIICLLLEML